MSIFVLFSDTVTDGEFVDFYCFLDKCPLSSPIEIDRIITKQADSLVRIRTRYLRTVAPPVLHKTGNSVSDKSVFSVRSGPAVFGIRFLWRSTRGKRDTTRSFVNNSAYDFWENVRNDICVCVCVSIRPTRIASMVCTMMGGRVGGSLGATRSFPFTRARGVRLGSGEKAK